MPNAAEPDFDTEARRLEEKLPRLAGTLLRWARKSSWWLRWPMALLFITGGLVGFLPILGFWMIPLGLILVAQDMPFIRAPLARLFAWISKKLD